MFIDLDSSRYQIVTNQTERESFGFTADQVWEIIAPSPYPLNQSCTISSEEIMSLKIDFTGKSESYPNSRFTCEYLGTCWKVTRIFFFSETITIPNFYDLDKKHSLEITLSMQKLISLPVPYYSIERLPPLFASGCLGQLYALNEVFVFKIVKRFTGANMRQSFYLQSSPDQLSDRYNLYVSKAKSDEMSFSFSSSIQSAMTLRSLPNNCSLISCHGALYVEDLNLWGVIFERVKGQTLNFSRFRNCSAQTKMTAAIEFAKWCASTLLFLQKNNLKHGDLKEQNIMEREPNSFVLIDLDLGGYDPRELSDRWALGTLFYRHLVCDYSTFQYRPFADEIHDDCLRNLRNLNISPHLISVINACWSNESLDKFGYDSILKALE